MSFGFYSAALSQPAISLNVVAGQLKRRCLLWLAIGRPRLHQRATLLKRVTTTIGALGLVASDMGKSRLGHFAGKCRYLAAPVSKRASEAVHRYAMGLGAAQDHFHRHAAQRLAEPLAWKNVLASLGRRERF